MTLDNPRFEQLFGCPARVVVRSPGRVNLIGEHTDYSNLPVLPVAMDRATRVWAAATDDGRLRAHSEQLAPDADLPRRGVGDVVASWHRYLAGVATLLADQAEGQGARIWIDGDLPTTGGLSSSSSLTMGLLAALNQVWRLGLELQQLVELAIVAERHVGVESGGMDQTVIAHAREGSALRIDFAPTRTRAVPLPPELCIMVAYSGQEAPKGTTVRQAYNDRVLGCRLAAVLLGAEAGVDAGDPPVLGSVAAVVSTRSVEALPEETSALQVARRLGIDARPLVRLTAGELDGAAAVRVRAVARHVLGEALRVDQAEQALVASELQRFGELLDSSHASLSHDFGCSTPALDRLCQAMRAAGALGARLTGAGFGGYGLAAVTEDRLDAVLDAANWASPGPAFETHPAAGLTVI